MKRNEKGFTLIELLVVVAIIGILAAIAIPQFSEYRKRGFDARALSDLRNAATGEEAYFADNEVYVTCASAAACAGVLPGYIASGSVVLTMTATAAAGVTPAYFTGQSAHPQGSKNSTGAASTRYDWDSRTGGLQ
jgi:type IV pilus assembly protein PilA